MDFFPSAENRRWVGWIAAMLCWNGPKVTCWALSLPSESAGAGRAWDWLPDEANEMVTGELGRLLCPVQCARMQKRTGCWCQEPKWLCSVLLGKPFPGRLGTERFIASLPRGSHSSQEWKIPEQTCTQVLYGNVSQYYPFTLFSVQLLGQACGSVGEEEILCILFDSAIGPQN